MDQDDIQGGASRKRTWVDKFNDALRGLRLAIAGQSSYLVHFLVAIAVLTCAALFRCSRVEWCVLILAITMVFAAETFNSAIEAMAKAIDRNHNERLGRSLDMAGGAVLICAFGAAIVGAIVFIFRLGMFTGWWT